MPDHDDPQQKPKPKPFAIGERVRVRTGMMDNGAQPFTFGGWVGTIIGTKMVDGTPMYVLQMDPETLAQMPPFYVQQCRFRGFDLDNFGISQGGLELYDGSPIVVEGVEKLRDRPLNPAYPDDRIRAIFGLTAGDPLPNVSVATLEIYHDYLQQHLALPFVARAVDQSSRLTAKRKVPIGISGLEDLAPDCVRFGIICTGQMGRNPLRLPLLLVDEIRGKSARLIEDYRSWFVRCKDHRDMEKSP